MPAAKEVSMDRPNILILMTDEHRADLSGFGGNNVVRTPVLDTIAATGVVFDNAYTPSPVCVPARQCLMAGQLPTTCRCTGWYDLAPNYYTFARHFSRYGYHTVCAGKLHHEGTDQMQGWMQRIGDECKVAPRYLHDRDEESFRHHSRPFGEYKWSDVKEIARAGAGEAFYQKTDAYNVVGAKNFIESYFLSPYYDREKGNHQPLMLKVSLNQPHYPYFADEKLFKYYLNRVEPYLDEPLFEHPFLSERAVRPGVDASPRELRRATAAYYAMVETIDRHFGEVLGALEDVGQDLDDWIVVYMSDHGEMLGEHSIWEKQKFFESSVRVPMVLRPPQSGPGAPGRRRENVSLIDLFPTLCELSNLPVPSGLDGRSLAPLLRDPNGPPPESWNNEVVSMFSKSNQPLLPEERRAWDESPIHDYGGMNLMIKQDDLKYQYYGEHMPEVLFDLVADPTERRNLVEEATYTEAVASFRRRRGELGFGPG
jgi:choline-sulfatase